MAENWLEMMQGQEKQKALITPLLKVGGLPGEMVSRGMS